MKNQQLRRYGLVVALVLVLLPGFGRVAVAETSSSTHYMVNETQIGTGAELNQCSASFCAKTSTGDTTVGSASSSDYAALFGSNTTDEPLLEVVVTGGTQDMGVLDSSHTGTAVSTIKIRSYLSGGYTLHITGAAPSQGTHTLKAMIPTGQDACPCTSQPGAEQFGINLAANDSPAIGAAEAQVPSSAFSFGYVTGNYNQPNLFVYDDGDAVAASDKSTGETDYTLSMIINVSNVTPGGQYKGTYSAVAVPVF